MRVMKNYQIILTIIVSYGVGFGILNGSIPSHYFAGPLNELGCAVIALTMGTVSLFGLPWKSIGKFLIK
jgi:hypothetical protein